MGGVMKGLLILLLGTMFGCLCDVSLAQDAWLLLYANEHHTVVKAGPNGFRNIVNIGDRTTYGESPHALGVLSQRKVDGKFVLNVIDKVTLRVTSSWPVSGHPTGQLSGPSRDVVLAHGFAYFSTIRYTADRTGIVPNEVGGSFDFHQLSLGDGKLRTLPLPESCRNPRFVNLDGIPWVYSWNGAGVWKFDAAKGSLEEIVSSADIEDSIITADADAGALAEASRPGAFADYVLLPRAGVFRLSRLGTFQQILNADLRHVNGSREALDVGLGADVVRVYAVTFKGKPAVGVLRKEADRTVFAYMEPLSSKVQWQTPISKGVVPDSLLSAGDAIYYVDRDTTSIMKISSTETKEVWNLKRDAPGVDVADARIISIANVP